MRLSTVILPVFPWAEGRSVWRRADELGFHAGYTYDHLSWRSFRDRTWFGAVPTLAGAAAVTRTLRLGPLVTSPNFRHPVTLAKDLMSLDDLSAGRLVVGIGSGGTGFDATVLGSAPWTPGERADRFDEFVPLLDGLLRHPITTEAGAYYSAVEARMIPGCVQRPRVPFVVAATGPRGYRLAAELGEGWVTFGDPGRSAGASASADRRAVRSQLEGLEAACAARGRSFDSIEKVLLQSPGGGRPLDSLDAFVDWAGHYAALGITELVVHWPIAGSVFDADPGTFERIATEGLGQLGASSGARDRDIRHDGDGHGASEPPI
jgi:alkanesulfonate monooxygenase SsuD/methylene tetrahydromethanopterin reductase-like flavin-dependent oxidoreductase (luciferase family)